MNTLDGDRLIAMLEERIVVHRGAVRGEWQGEVFGQIDPAFHIAAITTLKMLIDEVRSGMFSLDRDVRATALQRLQASRAAAHSSVKDDA